MPKAVSDLGLAHYGPNQLILLFSGTMEAQGRPFLFQSGVRAKSHLSLINLQAHRILPGVARAESGGL